MSLHIMRAVSRFPVSSYTVVTVLIFLTGCIAQPESEKTSIQLHAFQAKEFKTTKKIAFASTMSVFQDLGYVIGTADLETGFITGKSPTKQRFVLFIGQEMSDVRATAFVEPTGQNRARIRLNFVNTIQTSSGYGMKGAHDNPIEEPDFYQNVFAKITKAIFVRENIEE